MPRTHLVIPDSNAHYEHHNRRAEKLGRLIFDLRPDVVIHMGDSADMPSLSAFDKGRKAAIGRTYRADIDAHLDFNERLWHTYKKNKKGMPETWFLEGNHEFRIKRAINVQPELEGTVGFKDLELQRWYDNVIEYDGNIPGVGVIDGVHYAHYFISGVKGLPVGGEHAATTLLTKKYGSCTAAHSHVADWSARTSITGKKLFGCVAGCYLDYHTEWAGDANKMWWRGIVIKRNVEDGVYSPQFVSLEEIEKQYPE